MCGASDDQPPRSTVRVIDVHNHFYPPSYLEAVRHGPGAVEVTEDAEGNPVLPYPGDYNIAVKGHRAIAYRHERARARAVSPDLLCARPPGWRPSLPGGVARPGVRGIRRVPRWHLTHAQRVP